MTNTDCSLVERKISILCVYRVATEEPHAGLDKARGPQSCQWFLPVLPFFKSISLTQSMLLISFPFPSRQSWLPKFLSHGNVFPFSPRLSSTTWVWWETQICYLELISVHGSQTSNPTCLKGRQQNCSGNTIPPVFYFSYKITMKGDI